MNEVFVSKNIDSWAVQYYPEIFNELVKLTNSLEHINNKIFKRKTLLKIKQIKTNLFDSYNLLEKKILDTNLLFKEIDKTSNAETPDKMSKTSICFGFTPLLYKPIGFEELPLVMSARHTYLCTNPFGFYNDRFAHYHNLDTQVLKDIPHNIDNVIFIYHSQTHKESICCVLDYDIDIKNEFGDKTGNKTKLQLFIKPKASNVNTFHYALPIESNLIASMYEYTPECVSNLIYVNKNKMSLAQQLISHDIRSKDRVEVVFNSGFYINNIKQYQKSVNKILQLKHPFLIDEKFILHVNEEINKNDNPDINSIIQSYPNFKLKEPSLPNSKISPASSEIYQEEDVTKIINKSLEMENGKITEKGWNDISKTIQMYSDKRYETARYLFVRDGKIIRHVAVSNQNPSSTISQPDKDFLFQLRTYAKQTDSSVVFVHNHPSGHVEPSQADIDTTNYIKNFFNIDDKNHFAGHIILDHGTFGLYEANQNKWFALINEKFHSMEEGREYFSIQGSDIGINQIKNKDDLIQLSEYAQKIDRTGNYNINEWIPAFFATHNGIVRTLEYINNEDFSIENLNSLKAHIKYVGRESGSNHVYFVPKTHKQKMLCEAFAQQTGIVQDVFYLKEDGSYELSKWSGGDIFNTLSEEEIKRDDSLNYEIPETKENEIMDNIKQEINVEEEFDKFVESMDVNGGLPEAALEADYEAELSSSEDYYDEEEVLDDNIIENQISTFDKELQLALENKLSDNHIFTLGKPSEILQKCGFPENQRIELSLSHLKYKASLNRHPFELDNLFGLEEALQNPIGVFEYGDKQKSQNVFVDIEKEGKHFLVGIHFNQEKNNFKVSSIRTVYPKDSIEVLNWIRQGRMIYGNKEKIQVLINQQRMNVADVENKVVQSPLHKHYLDSTESIMLNFGDVNDIFTQDFDWYSKQKDKFEIYKKFNSFLHNESFINASELAEEFSDEFYDALENKNLEIIKRYTSFDDNYEVSHLAREIFAEKANIEISNITTSNDLDKYINEYIYGNNILNEEKVIDANIFPDESINEEAVTEESVSLDEGLQEPTMDSIPVMPSIPEDLNTELSQVLKNIQEELALMKKENLELRKENEMLKGKLNNISSNQDIKEYGENSYTEVTKDIGTSRTFNSQNAFTVNTPIPTFGHENENGELELIENAHFAHWEENKLDNSKNRVTLEYSTKQGEIKQIVMDEYDYRKMINACEELERNKNSVEMGSYEWILYHERYNKVMKTDQNKLRLNFASNFIHNYRIMCKLYASNPQEAVEQAKKLVDMMLPNERRAFNRMRKEAGKENFDNILLEEFKAHAQGIENKKSLLLNNNELLYDVNKDNLELKQGEQLGKSGKCVGDTVKMAFKFRNFDGKLVKTPKLDFKILKVTKNQNPDMAIVYNDEEKIAYKVPLTDFMKHLQKVNKQQHKENAEQIKKDHKFYGYEGR